MKQVIKKIVGSALTVITFMNSAYSLSLNKQEHEFYQTQTGSYLHAMYPMLKPKEAIKTAIDHVVTTHKEYIDMNYTSQGITIFDYAKKQEEIENLYQKVKVLLKKEIEFKDTHCIFYHGHSNAMSSYNDALHELMEIAGMKELEKSHPLHYKTSTLNKLQDMNDFLSNDRYLKGHIENVQDLRKKAIADPENYGQYKDLTPFNSKNNLGVGKAPDSAPFARDHLHCVNLSLFGNSENSHESSFLFFLTSGNIGKMDRYLTTRLFQDTGILSKTATQAEIDQKIDSYEKLFADKMALAGGGMLQILMKNEIVDKYSFASWAKGVPYFMNRKTGKFATRGSNNRAIPILTNGTKNLVRPSLVNMIKQYKEDPTGFSQKYSHDGKTNLTHVDRVQARLFVNPKIFANKNLVQIHKINRLDVDPAAVTDYKTKLHNQMVTDLTTAVSTKQLTKDFYANEFALGKLVKFVFSKETKVSHIVDIILKSSTAMFEDVLGIIKEATGKLANVSAKILEKINALETINTIKTTLKNAGQYTKDLIKKVLKAFK